MRDICDNFAAQGYLACAPDLFWRQEPGVQLTDQTEEEWARASELYQGFDVAKGVADIQSTITALRDDGEEKVGTVGFCLGGLLAYLSACRTNADANVSYYGVGIEGYLDEVIKIDAPTMLHIAEEDSFVDKAAQAKVRDRALKTGHTILHFYAGCEHAFTRKGGERFDAVATTLAHKRTVEFFAQHLRC